MDGAVGASELDQALLELHFEGMTQLDWAVVRLTRRVESLEGELSSESASREVLEHELAAYRKSFAVRVGTAAGQAHRQISRWSTGLRRTRPARRK